MRLKWKYKRRTKSYYKQICRDSIKIFAPRFSSLAMEVQARRWYNDDVRDYGSYFLYTHTKRKRSRGIPEGFPWVDPIKIGAT